MIKSNPQSQAPNPQSQDGIIVIDKPEGLTSHDVVARARKLLKTRRIGHTGTLDPFATGALVICIDRATRLVQFLTGDEKEYVATMRLGFDTDTGDLTGTPKTPVTDSSKITSDNVQESFVHFLGHIKQVPPMYSAKKVGGVKLYEMARRGEEIERAPIEVEIKKLELLKPAGEPVGNFAQSITQNEPGEFSFRVVCSSGTYVRTLAEDIGRFLGVGAHLTALRRTRAGSLSLDAAVTLEELADLAQSGQANRAMISMSNAVAMPTLLVGEEERKRISHGRSIERPSEFLENFQLGGRLDGRLGNRPDIQTDFQADFLVDGALVKVCDKKNQLIAIAEYDSTKILWHPRVVLVN